MKKRVAWKVFKRVVEGQPELELYRQRPLGYRECTHRKGTIAKAVRLVHRIMGRALAAGAYPEGQAIINDTDMSFASDWSKIANGQMVTNRARRHPHFVRTRYYYPRGTSMVSPKIHWEKNER
jgi:hypothetical protein